VDKPEELPEEIKVLVAERQAARDAKDWAASDRLRDAIQDQGYTVQDTKDGIKVIKN
jgi:cysteinyl-tRNA synthetase